MKTVRLVFKESSKGDGVVSFKFDTIDKSEGYYAFVANSNTGLKMGVLYDCKVIEMYSKKGFIVKEGKPAADFYELIEKEYSVKVLQRNSFKNVTGEFLFDPSINGNYDHVVSKLLVTNDLRVPSSPVNFTTFVVQFASISSQVYNRYRKLMIKQK